MQPAITHVEPDACAIGEMENGVGVEAQFETAVVRLRMHLVGMGCSVCRY